MDIGRKADLEYLIKKLPSAVGSEKKEIEEAIKKISNESGLTKSMREALIRETRAGRADNVRDIREYVVAKQKRRNIRWLE